jgi:excisionase family DNA binding protein
MVLRAVRPPPSADGAPRAPRASAPRPAGDRLRLVRCASRSGASGAAVLLALLRAHGVGEKVPRAMSEPLIVPLAEACRQLGCGRTKVFELVRAGRLVRVRVGRGMMIGAASLRAYLESLIAPAERPARRSPAPRFEPFTRADLKARRVLRMQQPDRQD